jgi:hypothetical protein
LRIAGDPPFLLELAHYEWVELALDIAPDSIDPAGIDPNGDLLAGVPVVSPVAWSLGYRFAVHRIGPDFQPERPGPEPTRLVVYRTRQGGVEFLEVNAVTARLLDLLEQNDQTTGRDALTQIAAELCTPCAIRSLPPGRNFWRTCADARSCWGPGAVGATPETQSPSLLYTQDRPGSDLGRNQRRGVLPGCHLTPHRPKQGG